jgi:polysaccharide biosynthesis/export protein
MRMRDMLQLIRKGHACVKSAGVLLFSRCALSSQSSRTATLFAAIACLLLAGCATQSPIPNPPRTAELSNAHHDDHLSAATAEAIRRFDDNPHTRYTLGPGDKVNATVWARPELSGQHVVGPDGDIQIPFLGSVRIADMNPDQASAKLSSALSEYYLGAYATITMLSYSGNTVTVLGHVGKPGQFTFSDNPTLLEVLAKADTRAAGSGKAAEIKRCAIFRGRDRAIWIDLGPLYRGDDLALNIRLQRGDYIYVPEPTDQLVYVMGQVNKPGAFELTPGMSFLDALAQAGGPSDAGQPAKIVLARPRENMQQVIDLKTFLASRGDNNYTLQEGDIIYVPKSGIAKVGYVLQQINPITSTLIFGAALF